MKGELKKKVAAPAEAALYSNADYNESFVAQFEPKDVDPFNIPLTIYLTNMFRHRAPSRCITGWVRESPLCTIHCVDFCFVFQLSSTQQNVKTVISVQKPQKSSSRLKYSFIYHVMWRDLCFYDHAFWCVLCFDRHRNS